jgi:hypothetical protein
MSEDHQIVSPAHGEPLPEGCTGVRVRVQLSGCPSRRCARDLAWLSRELVGHAAVGHLRLNVDDIVQADQIVLGVLAGPASVEPELDGYPTARLAGRGRPRRLHDQHQGSDVHEIRALEGRAAHRPDPCLR